jgi:dipeptidyl aminopeptidase/acylaminoacyl peptidase
MSKYVRRVALAALVCSLNTTHAAPAPVEAYGRRPALIDVDLNPAGTHLAWIEDNGKEARVIIHDLAAQKDVRTVNASKNLTLHSIYWTNDQTLLVHESQTEAVSPGGRDVYQFWRWIAIDLGGGKNRLLLMNGGDRAWVTGADLIRRRTSKPGKIFMSTLDFSETNYRQSTGSRLAGGRKDNGWISNLYEVDLATGDGKVVQSGTPYTTHWRTDESGERIVRSDFNPKSDLYSILVKDGGGWRKLYEATRCGHLGLIGLDQENAAVLAMGELCGETRAKIVAFPLDGTPLRVVAEHAELEVDSTTRDPYDDRLLGYGLGGTDQSLFWIDAAAEKRAAGLRRTFANSAVRIISRSANGRRVVVVTENASQPPIYFLVDYDAKSADIINELYPNLAGVKLGEVREFDYEARDKYALFAYLTLPPNGGDKGLPLIVMPHGGPEARDEPGFNWLAQFLASRGYAVLQPQFRGSSGFGKPHADAGRRQWGLRMQDDVTDAVRAAISQGIADPKRVCIVGWSYGGYAALAGAAFTPELYACAASIAGVSSLPSMLAYESKSSGDESNSLDYWKEHIGPSSDPQVIAKSPSRSAATVRAPILLLHGTEDTVVPIEQSRLMARALEAAKKPFEFFELPGDDHHLHDSVTRVKMATELEKFLAKHLPAAPAATAQTTN